MDLLALRPQAQPSSWALRRPRIHCPTRRRSVGRQRRRARFEPRFWWVDVKKLFASLGGRFFKENPGRELIRALFFRPIQIANQAPEESKTPPDGDL